MRVNKLALVLVLSCLAYEVNAKETLTATTKELEKRLDAELVRVVEVLEAESLEAKLKEIKDTLAEQERCMGLEGLEWEQKSASWKIKTDSDIREMDSCAKNKRDLETCTVMKVKRAVKACQELADEKKEILNDK